MMKNIGGGNTHNWMGCGYDHNGTIQWVITSWVCGFNDDLGNDEAGLELSVSDAIKCGWSKQLE